MTSLSTQQQIGTIFKQIEKNVKRFEAVHVESGQYFGSLSSVASRLALLLKATPNTSADNKKTNVGHPVLGVLNSFPGVAERMTAGHLQTLDHLLAPLRLTLYDTWHVRKHLRVP